MASPGDTKVSKTPSPSSSAHSLTKMETPSITCPSRGFLLQHQTLPGMLPLLSSAVVVNNHFLNICVVLYYFEINLLPFITTVVRATGKIL